MVVVAASAVFWIPIAPFLVPGAGEETLGAATVRLALLETSNEKAVEYVLRLRPDIVVIADPSAPRRDHSADLADAYPVRLALSQAGGPIILARQGFDVQPDVGGAPDLLRAHVVHERQSFDLAVVHLDRPWPLGPASSPAAQLAARLAGDTQRLVLVGDFNRSPWTTDMKQLREALHVSAKAPPATWPTWLPRPLRLPLDLVLVGGDLGVRGLTTGPSLGSDHLPIIANIALQP